MSKWLVNAITHPKTTTSGIISLASGATMIAGMVKGTVPVSPESIVTLSGLVSTGLGLIFASDSKVEE